MTTLTMRPYAGEADLQPICDLLNHCDAVDRLDDSYAVEDLRLEFDDPRLDPARDLRLWEGAGGQLVGFGQTWVPQDAPTGDGFLYWRLHPGARGDGIEGELIAWGGQRIREATRGRGLDARLISSAREHDAYSRGVLTQHGMAPIRYFYKMSRPLGEPIEDTPLPEGFTLRHVASDADIAAWVDAYNLSFIDHWNHHPRTVESHRHWLRHPSYQPERDLIAVAPDGTVAAICFCNIDPEENARNGSNAGSVHILGTRRGYRKIGLGRAILLSGLRRLRDDGVDTARLNVDAENPTGALRLYESVGFSVTYMSIAYAQEL